MKAIISTVAGCLAATVAFAAIDANAATIRVECEQRVAERSKVSVDGHKLSPLPAGQMYRGQVVSGANSATSPGEKLAGDEVGFDFDSDRGDIAEGAVAIPANFIVNGNVTGKILAPDGTTVISDTVACRVRNH